MRRFLESSLFHSNPLASREPKGGADLQVCPTFGFTSSACVWFCKFILRHRIKPILLRVRFDPDVFVIENTDGGVDLHPNRPALQHRRIRILDGNLMPLHFRLAAGAAVTDSARAQADNSDRTGLIGGLPAINHVKKSVRRTCPRRKGRGKLSFPPADTGVTLTAARIVLGGQRTNVGDLPFETRSKS